MRYVLMLALALAWALSPEAEAGAKPKGGDAAADAAKDPYAYPEMEVTNVADIDSFFATAKEPITSVIDARKQVDMAQKDLGVTLGFAEGTPFADMAADLQKKADKKIKVAMKGKMPRLEASEAVPDDVQKSIDAFNKALGEMEGAFTKLEEVEPKLTELASKSEELVTSAPDTIKSAGLPPTKVPTALAATKKNAKTVADSRAELGKLKESLGGISTDLQAAFAG